MTINEICELKQQIIHYGKKLGEKNMSPATSGNISVRKDGQILITGSGTCLADLCEDEIVIIDSNANLIDGKIKPSSEKNLHTAIYAIRPDINAIIHCHSPYASAFAVCRIPLSKPIISENVFYFGKIPLAEYGMPSSVDLVEKTAMYFNEYDAVLMANHGFIVGSRDIKDAFLKLTLAESYAQVVLNTKILGGAKILNDEQVKEIYDLRKKL